MRTVHQAGTSLVEVLIAVSILSFGILGIARMQTSAITSTSLAYQYSQAALLAQSIAEDIRANPVAAAAGFYQVSPDGDPRSSDKDCAQTNCSPIELARWHLATWTSLLGRSTNDQAQTPSHMLPFGLGAGRLGISCPEICKGDSVQVITIYWDARHSGATGTDCRPDSTSDLTCFQLAQAL